MADLQRSYDYKLLKVELARKCTYGLTKMYLKVY